MNERPDEDATDDERDDARWREAWRATPATPVPEGWQSTLMQDLRDRQAAPAPSSWAVPLAAAALVVLALGAAALLGVRPARELRELAAFAGDESAAVLQLPGAR